VRHQWAAAVQHWWGGSEWLAWRWRKVLGGSRTNNEGTSQLILAVAQKGGTAMVEAAPKSDATRDR